ncbi:MAG: hypothetical protein AMXMBFR82_32200 [Candidatus Hydrogenedentota bacterium]
MMACVVGMWSLGAFAQDGQYAVDPAKFEGMLREGHPRLMLLDDRLAELKAAAPSDPALQSYVSQVIEQADSVLDEPKLEHVLAGPRLLSVSRNCVRRIYALGLAWRWTGDEKYARAAEDNLLTVCAFPDWNPSHFLDTAEMSHAVGVGYDWFYSYLSDESRQKIRDGLIELGMKPGKIAYENDVWWAKSEFNWNQVCNAGLTVGALAIAETNPEWMEFIVPRAVASLPKALAAYGPDGAWMEGPGYWHYATRYTAYGLCAMDTALGTDFGLSGIEGLSVTGLFPTYTTGPTGLLLNYADSGERSSRRPMPCMFWLAQKYGNAFIGDAEHAVVSEQGADPLHVVWYVAPSGKALGERDLDRHFESPVDIIVMRSAWDDPNALFVGVKGGYNQVNHGHLDLGNFEIDALGVRWARDLGSDNYNLPGYWDRKPGGDRWQYYRLNSQSHNMPLLNGEDQDAGAVAKVLRFESNPGHAFVTLDLTSAYYKQATKVTRGVSLTNDRKAVLVQDEFVLSEPCEIQWGMTTDAHIEPHSDGTATLTLDGKQLIARILSPEGAQFTVGSAEQEEPQRTNKGVNRLLVRTPAEGEVTIAIQLAPLWGDGAAEADEVVAVNNW